MPICFASTCGERARKKFPLERNSRRALPGFARKDETMNDEHEVKTEVLPARSNDGFEGNDDTDRLLQGTRLVCIDGEWKTPDGTAIPPGKRYLVLGVAEGLQHWQGGELLKEIIKRGDERLPDIAPLNAAIPRSEWDEGINGPREPWTHVFAVYLLDPEDGSIHTHINSTNGAAKATRELRSRVRWKRAMLGGRKVSPIVVLGKQLVSVQFKKWGPNFIPVEWRDLDPLLPAQSAPRQIESHVEKEAALPNDPDIGRAVEEPSYSEILDDKIPEDDWQPVGEPAPKAPKAPATPPHKPAVQKPQTTKKGAQKIAGGRR
jgi:hypothetical protein